MRSNSNVFAGIRRSTCFKRRPRFWRSLVYRAWFNEQAMHSMRKRRRSVVINSLRKEIKGNRKPLTDAATCFIRLMYPSNFILECYSPHRNNISLIFLIPNKFCIINLKILSKSSTFKTLTSRFITLLIKNYKH